MRMCFMQEARRESVSASYVWKNARFDHWVIRVSRALVRYLFLAGESSQNAPKRPQQLPRMLEQMLEQRTAPTNETGHVEFSNSQGIWSRDKQQTKQA